MKLYRKYIVAAVLLGIGFAGRLSWVAMRAHRGLVTLNVRNMDVRQVVRKLEHQTWQGISVDKGVQGKVTLNVQNMPLEEVLRIVGDQNFSRSLVIYPLYSTRKSLAALKEALRGELDPATHGWTNLQREAGGFRGGPIPAGFGGGPGAPFGAMAENARQLVSLEIRNKDLSFTTLAFSRFAQARVVPEDGTAGMVSLSTSKAPVAKAVAALAKKVNRSWTKLYVLRGGFGPGGPGGPQFAARKSNGLDRRGPDRRGQDGPPEMTDQQREEMRKERAALEQELREVLPSDERQKLEEGQQQREQQMQELANLSPEQRRDRMGQMFGPNGGMDKMNRQRVLNSTPEQRADMTRREREMRQRGQQPGQPPQGGPRRYAN